MHEYGNFTVQDVIEVAGKLRSAVATAPALATCVSSFKSENKGLDPLGE